MNPLVNSYPRGRFLKEQVFLFLRTPMLAMLFGMMAPIPAVPQTSPTKPLTIETMYQPGGLTGRAPETMEWSPDGVQIETISQSAPLSISSYDV